MARRALARLVDVLASPRLTLITLGLLMALVVLCTLAEAHMGVYGAVQTYMRSLLVWWPFPGLPFRIPVFPGGIPVGLLLVINLVAALVKRSRLGWKQAGLWIAHAGLILLVAGEFCTGAFQVETVIRVEEGQGVNFAESPRELELAVIDTTDPSYDLVYSVPATRLGRSKPIPLPGTPLTLQIKRYLPNEASALVEPMAGGISCGIWLVSSAMEALQTFTHRGRTYALTLRPLRAYLPCTLTLKKFHHDVYPGTDIPRNYSSLMHLSNPSRGEERDVLICMNQPLRYEGRAFYQAGYDRNDTVSILQVVQNPGWRLPYVSCALITLGLLFHFSLALFRSPVRRPE